MSTQKSNNYRLEHPDFFIEISRHSGFCFGVVNAIHKAEDNLNNKNELYCIGSIVHNDQEVKRLSHKGLRVISINEALKLKNKTILFRAHGEPPASYQIIKQTNNSLIDATCPVVLKIQQRIKTAWINSKNTNGQIAIFGKQSHAEVIGLLGQTEFEGILISNENDIDKLDFNRPIELFAQTTKSLEDYNKISTLILNKAKNSFKANDTICRQVSNRNEHLQEFAQKFEIVFFIGDRKSSNSMVLFDTCLKANQNSIFITNPTEINSTVLKKANSFGVCGATSTPQWLMEDVAKRIEQIKLGI